MRLPAILLPLFLLSCISPISSDPMITLQSPGFLAAISEPGRKPDIRAIGHADWEKTRPMSTDMRMRAGSVTKLFTGALVLILCDEGKLDLDHPIARYVDGVPNGDRITLRQLGHHTSGLPDAIANRDFQKAIVADPSRVWTSREILSFAFSQPPVSAPGQRWRYSNANTILLALAAEKAAGAPWEKLLANRVLRPLGLDHTLVPPGGELPSPRTRAYRHGKPGHPIGYGRTLFDVTRYNASWAHAAGDLCITIADLHAAAGPLCRGELLSEKSRRELFDWHDTGEPGHRYGFCIESWNGFTGHRGDVPGYQAIAAVHQPTGAIVAVLANLSNTTDGKGPANELAARLVAELTPPPSTSRTGRANPASE